MAVQAESPAAYSPTVVAGAFVKQYYQTLCSSRQDAYKFYNDSSILGRSDSNGNVISVTTINDIKKQLLSMDFTDCLIELETVDCQPSHVDGVLILVVGYVTIDGLKQKFTQSFFLAPQGSGYFVLNDMLRLAKPTKAKEVVANHVDGSTQTTALPAEPDTASIKESTVPNIPPTENAMPVNDEVISPSTNAVSQVKNDAVVETCAKVVINDIKKAPEAASAPPPPAEKEVPKKTYASIVRESIPSIPPAPAAKPKPNPRPKAAQSAEKSVSSPTKPAHATNTAPPGDKNVSTNKAPDVPGYSVFVKNLPFDATVEMVAQEFSKFGAIKPGGIQVRKHQFDRFCFGFVEFESQQSMEAAIKASAVYFGSWKSFVEEKLTKTRVVDGVVTHGDDNGGRFQSGRGGYYGDNFRGQGGFRNNGYQNEYPGRGRGPQGNGYQQNRNGYNQNGNGYPQNANGYQQRRPYNNGNGNGNGNGRVERSNGPKQQTPVAS
ncbi:unnamed protein product [Urochloa decumbens]|uniref:Uncharacterized protein n=1 Tax=Urochloa decumbens TaxID=240449 RepID=A0ABC9FZU6_9POAL